MSAEYNKIMRDKRYAAGLCVNCGKRQHIENKKECDVCKESRSLRQKKDYAERKSNKTELRKILRDQRKSEGLCTNCGNETDGKARCQRCREVYNNRIQQMKDKCYKHYGGYECACCGETIKQFLTVDHINNDGAAHRRSMKNKSDGSGKQLYSWIINNNFPPMFQILCSNCNFGKHKNGGICPHKSIV